MEVLPLDGAATMPGLVDAIARRRLICLLADRDLTGAGIEVDLLGRKAKVPAGPALLARRTGAAVIPASFAYDGRETVLTFHPPVEAGRPSHMMQTVADAFTAGIREHPEDWHMMQRVFS